MWACVARVADWGTESRRADARLRPSVTGSPDPAYSHGSKGLDWRIDGSPHRGTSRYISRSDVHSCARRMIVAADTAFLPWSLPGFARCRVTWRRPSCRFPRVVTPRQHCVWPRGLQVGLERLRWSRSCSPSRSCRRTLRDGVDRVLGEPESCSACAFGLHRVSAPRRIDLSGLADRTKRRAPLHSRTASV